MPCPENRISQIFPSSDSYILSTPSFMMFSGPWLVRVVDEGLQMNIPKYPLGMIIPQLSMSMSWPVKSFHCYPQKEEVSLAKVESSTNL